MRYKMRMVCFILFALLCIGCFPSRICVALAWLAFMACPIPRIVEWVDEFLSVYAERFPWVCLMLMILMICPLTYYQRLWDRVNWMIELFR